MSDHHPIHFFFSSHHPLWKTIKFDFSGSKDDTVLVKTAAPEILRYNDEDNRVHTGFSTLLLDTIMGGAVMGVLSKIEPIATVGLATNHLRRADIGEVITGKAVCNGIYNNLAYVSGELTSEAGEILALSTGTFMIGTRSTSIRNTDEKSRI